MVIRVVISMVAIVFTGLYAITNTVVDNHKKDNPKVVIKESDKNIIQLYQTKPLYTSQKQLDCLARNIFFEAGTEDQLGKYAVGQVTLNRLYHGYWGNTICEVVYAKAQFSWTNSKKLRNARVQGQNWEDSYVVAESMLSGVRVRNLEKALFYHADYVNPFWKLEETQIAKFGKHVFYERAEGSWLRVID